MKQKFTPGPWRVNTDTSQLRIFGPVRDTNGMIAAVTNNNDATGNAILIAMAPELLETLKSIATLASAPEWVDDKQVLVTRLERIWKDANEAIAKLR